MRRALALASRINPGPFLLGLSGAFAFGLVVTAGVWMSTGRNSNPESRLVGAFAVASLVGFLVTLLALAAWGHRLARILSDGDVIIGTVDSLSFGKSVRIAVRVPSGEIRRVVLVGPVTLAEGQTVTLRSPQGKSWPLLIEEVSPPAEHAAESPH